MTLAGDDDFRLAVLRPIEDAILADTGNLRERMVALDSGGHVVLAKTGIGHQIELTPRELLLMAGRVDLMTHNHDDSSAFSIEDLAVAVLVNAREIDAFGPATRWRMIRSGLTWPPGRLVERAFHRADRVLQRELFRMKQAGTFAGDPFHWLDRGGAVWERLQREHPEWFIVVREDRRERTR